MNDCSVSANGKVSVEAELFLEIKCLAKQTKQDSNQNVNSRALQQALRQSECLGVRWGRSGLELQQLKSKMTRTDMTGPAITLVHIVVDQSFKTLSVQESLTKTMGGQEDEDRRCLYKLNTVLYTRYFLFFFPVGHQRSLLFEL